MYWVACRLSYIPICTGWHAGFPIFLYVLDGMQAFLYSYMYWMACRLSYIPICTGWHAGFPIFLYVLGGMQAFLYSYMYWMACRLSYIPICTGWHAGFLCSGAFKPSFFQMGESKHGCIPLGMLTICLCELSHGPALSVHNILTHSLGPAPHSQIHPV